MFLAHFSEMFLKVFLSKFDFFTFYLYAPTLSMFVGQWPNLRFPRQRSPILPFGFIFTVPSNVAFFSTVEADFEGSKSVLLFFGQGLNFC